MFQFSYQAIFETPTYCTSDSAFQQSKVIAEGKPASSLQLGSRFRRGGGYNSTIIAQLSLSTTISKHTMEVSYRIPLPTITVYSASDFSHLIPNSNLGPSVDSPSRRHLSRMRCALQLLLVGLLFSNPLFCHRDKWMKWTQVERGSPAQSCETIFTTAIRDPRIPESYRDSSVQCSAMDDRALLLSRAQVCIDGVL